MDIYEFLKEARRLYFSKYINPVQRLQIIDKVAEEFDITPGHALGVIAHNDPI